MATVLRTYCANAIKILGAQFDASSALTHGASLGSVREQAIRDFLEGHLPSLVRIVSGQVFDSSDSRSTQQDVILTLKNVPRLPFANGIDLVYADGVVATIEIKSSLSGPVLKSIGDGIRSVRALKPVIWSTSSLSVSHSWPPARILSAIVTYAGTSLDVLKTVLATMDDTSRPDLILDLSKGLLIQNHGFLVARQNVEDYVMVPNPADGFMYFLTFLTEITGTLGSRGVNWRSYL
jgi:hypothetical protein